VTEDQAYREQVRAWSNLDLLDVARHIDRDAHPERHRIIRAEIERRRREPAPAVVPPERRPAPSKYATFWRRVGANGIDWLIYLPVAIGAQFLAHASPDPMLQATPGFIVSLLFFLYSIVLHGRNGQTLGKRAAGVRVLDFSKEGLTVAQAITRDLVPLSFTIASFVVIVNVGLPSELSGLDFAALIPGLALLSIPLLWGLAEILTMATNRKRRAIHDVIAGSVVVRVGAARGIQ